MSEPRFLEFDDRLTLDLQLAEHVADKLRQAIGERGEATLVVSGGSTPKGFFAALSGHELPWSKLTVTLADERWVTIDHEDSNERMVRELLLAGPAADARFISLVNEDDSPERGLAAIQARLAQLGTFDVLVLGMGGDGHFASLFPGAEALDAGLDLSNRESCIAVNPPAAPHARVSMTLRRLQDTRCLIVHVAGEEKRRVLDLAIEQGDAKTLPIAAIMAAETPAPDVYWAP